MKSGCAHKRMAKYINVAAYLWNKWWKEVMSELLPIIEQRKQSQSKSNSRWVTNGRWRRNWKRSSASTRSRTKERKERNEGTNMCKGAHSLAVGRDDDQLPIVKQLVISKERKPQFWLVVVVAVAAGGWWLVAVAATSHNNSRIFHVFPLGIIYTVSLAQQTG